MSDTPTFDLDASMREIREGVAEQCRALLADLPDLAAFKQQSERVDIAQRAITASLTTDRTALATLRDAVREYLAAKEYTIATRGFGKGLDDYIAAEAKLAALTADHEEGGT